MISWQFDLHCDPCASLQFALLPWGCKVEQGRYTIMVQLESCTSLPIDRRSSTTRKGKDTTPWVLPFPSHFRSSFHNMGMEAKKEAPDWEKWIDLCMPILWCLQHVTPSFCSTACYMLKFIKKGLRYGQFLIRPDLPLP
jgi:hypothetical protein